MTSDETATLLSEYREAQIRFSNFTRPFWHNRDRPDEEFRPMSSADVREARRLLDEVEKKREAWRQASGGAADSN